MVLAAGTLGADALTGCSTQAQVGPVAVREMVGTEMLGYGAVRPARGVPRGWLAGVRGALTN